MVAFGIIVEVDRMSHSPESLWFWVYDKISSNVIILWTNILLLHS